VSRDHRLFLDDIAGACRKIIRYSSGRSRDAVFVDELRLDAILLNFLVIGEAVKNLPNTFRQEHEEIPWREIAGLRDFVAHAYFALDLDIVWSAIEVEIPRLLEKVEQIAEQSE